MSKFETTFKAAIAENERRILIDSLRSSPDLTIGEIHRLSKGGLGKLFNEITIADLMGGEGSQSSGGGAASGRGGKRGGGRRGGGAESGAAQGAGQGGGQGRRGRPRAEAPVAEASAPAAAAEGKQGKQRRGGKAKAVNTRTAEGRSAYDEALFQAVKESGGPAGAGALIARAGGSSLQARAGLARLIEAGRITWSGKARGTKYSVA